MSPELLNSFVRLAGAMSPENLHWDGERSRSAAAKALKGLQAQWRGLEQQAGRRVDEGEVWALYADAQRRAR